MILIPILIAWVAVTAVVLAACNVAARSDASLVRRPDRRASLLVLEPRRDVDAPGTREDRQLAGSLR